MATKHTLDRILLGTVALLVVGGFMIFSSASLGLLARSGASFSSVALSQFFFGILGGGAALFLMSSIHYRFWRQYAFYIFLFTLALTLLVFIPGFGFAHGGAVRWLQFGSFTFQPAEFLKIGFVIYMATWLSGMYRHAHTFKLGTLPFIGFVGAVGIIMLLQPDTDTFLVMAAAGVAMFLTAGGRFRDVLLMGLAGIALIAALAFSRPYVMDRITTFVNPDSDPLGASYQVHQSLIAVGSGGGFGRGFGQSIQKFEYLPEPIGDSIFAVYAEEFGFLGTFLLVILFCGFAFRGYRIATHAPDLFGTLLVIGFITLIVVQAFLNIAAMLALAPLGGLPLPFISHGGTALLVTLGSVGIVLNVSKYQKRSAK
ncbi:FtsW/RodA/SpoVE family cell cycle protein [Candidatus Parcubacteria bacterium]|uniref:Probable peptidoglycan glycosyltransferase FtsW n=1 Tax=Candidatus Kaiserbacteria bacterium CG10_big_fil_rev_8_21_14_0_10_47_16 TaxID=1974608 RepID=A0A2H0UE99_9BACT|nr:FtsW/RodA/SpoVE family cell cycle protein [Candidatus Parcubacteria bacterium]PIR84743.1 MAG: stage V sporulation protein E [Candidatus Kaiserbacteria bacterium CG10_big_fil_rev_8_21_14_0_10_47_16]